MCCLQGTPLPLCVTKSFCVQNFSKIPFSFCPQPLSFCRPHCHTASDRAVPPSLQLSKSSPSSLWVPPAWFLCELFAAWPALGTSFFSPTAMFPRFMCCSVLAGLKLLLVCYSALIFLILEGVQKYGPTMGISTGTSSMGISESLLPLWNALHKKVSGERRAKHLASAKWEIRSRSALSPFCKFVFHSLRLWLSIRQNTVVLWGQEGWHKANLTLSHL